MANAPPWYVVKHLLLFSLLCYCTFIHP
jgi:hypothetical protein